MQFEINSTSYTTEPEYSVECIYKRYIPELGQYWCLEEHDMEHCDVNCPYRYVEEEENFVSNFVSDITL